MSQLAATVGRWLPAALFTLANLYLAAILSLATWAFLPVAIGWTPIVITSGSMTPTISTGDIVVIDPYDGRELDVGTVVTYHETGRLVTHRIIDAIDGGYITQGDANREPDSTTLTPDAIEGTGRVLVPYLARPYTWFTSGRTGPALLWASLTVGAFAIVSLRTGVREAAADHPQPNIDSGARGAPAPGPVPVTGAAPEPAAARVGANERLAVSTASPQRPTQGVAPRTHAGRDHPDAETTTTPLETMSSPGAVWSANKAPAPTTAARSPGRTRGNLGTFLLTFAITMCVGLVLAVGTTAAPLSSATESSGGWKAQLDPPTGVSADPGCSNETPYVDVTWTANTSADGYDIHRQVNDGTWTLVHTTTDGGIEQWRDTDIADGDDYHYKLKAFLSSGWESDFSNQDSASVGGNLICL